MIKNIISSYKNIHFIGVLGVSMSGLADFLLNKGYNVSGSDVGKSQNLEALIAKGLIFFDSHSEKNINKNIDLVVFSGAISEDNVEIKKAKNLKIKIMERSEFLGLFCGFFKKVIAVSGSHGKTTTTALIGKLFLNAGLNPTIALGGNFADLKSNMIIGDGNILIIEACEYRESFKFLNPNISVITNIEKEHLDYYKNFENIKIAFQNFANRTINNIVFDKSCELIFDKSLKNIICGNEKNCLFSYKNLKTTKNGYKFSVYKKNKFYCNIKLNLMGDYNIRNAILSIAVADLFKINKLNIKNSLSQFSGIERRNELIGQIGKCEVYADYAHHPTEIKESLNNFKMRFKKVLCVFQPHTFSRTKTLKDEFKTCFSNADCVYIFKTFPAREKYDNKANGKMLENIITNKNKAYFKSKNSLIASIFKNASKYNVVLILGAGNIYEIIKKSINK